MSETEQTALIARNKAETFLVAVVQLFDKIRGNEQQKGGSKQKV